jgi:hypothetical protein
VVTKFTVVTDDITADQWLFAADDDVLGCRGQGHRFPKIRRGRPVRGIEVVPQRAGVSQIRSTCPDCKTIRVENTLPGGEIPDPHRYTYFYAEGYRPPKGVKVPRRRSFDETMRRVREDASRGTQIA